MATRRPPRPQRPPAPAPDPRLTALYSPNEVLASLPRGRQDPFAAPPGGPAAGAKTGSGASESTANKQPQRPAVQFTGVAQSAGRITAFVSFNSQSGSVAVGDQGSTTLNWLPLNWRVAGIDVQRGLLQLQAADGDQQFYQL